MKTISAKQMAKRKEKGMKRQQAFQNKERAEELAMGMVARNEALDRLGFKVKEEEIMSERAAKEQAERSLKPPGVLRPRPRARPLPPLWSTWRL